MKTRFIISAISAMLLTACTTHKAKYDAAMTIAVDQTDLLNQYPTAAQLLLPLGLKDDPNMGVTVTIQPLTDRDINPVFTYSLEREDALTGNDQLRAGLIKVYVKKVQHCLDSLRPNRPMQHSVIFKSVVAQANSLAAISSERHYLVLISDLNENAETSFYNDDTFEALQHQPDVVRQQLEKEAILKNLNRVSIWLLYRPDSYKDNKPYRIVSAFYKRLLEQHSAIVHIDQNFNPAP
jgi:hypothetical protein